MSKELKPCLCCESARVEIEKLKDERDKACDSLQGMINLSKVQISEIEKLKEELRREREKLSESYENFKKLSIAYEQIRWQPFKASKDSEITIDSRNLSMRREDSEPGGNKK